MADAGKALAVADDFRMTPAGWMRRRYAAVPELRRLRPTSCAAQGTHTVWPGGGWCPARATGDPFRTLRVTAVVCDHDHEPADLLDLLARLEGNPA